MSSRDHLFKVLVVGDAAVGKTSLVQRYSQDSFSKHYKSTVGGVAFGLNFPEVEECLLSKSLAGESW
uniref:RAB29, member RAS onco family n=1 Tax=Bos indicus x Bos taurus TaxID=30522 RepID=A0A4W2CK34_BOBOX